MSRSAALKLMVVALSVALLLAGACGRHSQALAQQPAQSAPGETYSAPGAGTDEQLQQALKQQRSGSLSFRAFMYLREKSPFPPEYAYLFVLLMATAAVRFLALPLTFKAAQLTVQVRRLQGEIDSIRRIYGSNPLEVNQKITELYQVHSINPWGGCGSGLVDIIFVVWAIYALKAYAPQMILDHSRFLWVADVTRFDWGIFIGCAVLGLFGALVTGTARSMGQSSGQLVIGTIIFNTVLGLIAAHRGWPSYIFVFWSLLTAVGMVLMLIVVLPMSRSRRY